VTTENNRASFYDESYKRQNYFSYHTWLYAPYISSLIKFSGLKAGDSVLDVGCGQGYFSYLFSRNGMRVHGVDLSETGIQMAESSYGRCGITFSLADVHKATFPHQFDCVFVRSCSLYNTLTFASDSSVTSTLLRHIKQDGIFIFAYNSNFSSKVSPTWRYHTLMEVKEHFSCYPNARIFFVNKLLTLLLGRYSFTPLNTKLSALLSKLSGLGGEFVCVLVKR